MLFREEQFFLKIIVKMWNSNHLYKIDIMASFSSHEPSFNLLTPSQYNGDLKAYLVLHSDEFLIVLTAYC